MLYVSYGDTGCGTSTLAYAGACAYDQYGRPTAGSVNICRNMLYEDTPDGPEQDRFWKKDVATMVHEIGHILIMNSLLWPNFRNPNNPSQSYEQANLTATNTTGDGQRWMMTPNVIAAVREHYNCNTLIGAPLDSDSHWDEKYLHSETMAPTV